MEKKIKQLSSRQELIQRYIKIDTLLRNVCCVKWYAQDIHSYFKRYLEELKVKIVKEIIKSFGYNKRSIKKWIKKSH